MCARCSARSESRSVSIGLAPRGWSGCGSHSGAPGTESASVVAIVSGCGFARIGRARRAARLWLRHVGLRCGGVCGWVRCGRAFQRRASCRMCRCVLFVLRWFEPRRGLGRGFVRTW